MKYAIVVGTRPEIIKMAPIVWEMEEKKLDYRVFFTGQHFSGNMSEDFFNIMEYPSYRLSKTGNQTEWEMGKEIYRLNTLMKNEKYAVLAEGDTISVIIAAVIAVYRDFPFIHVEAGLRSNDLGMREERFRQAADSMADILFCPLPYHSENVKGCLGKKFVVGNTIADVVNIFKLSNSEPITSKKYALITLHRNELLKNKKLFAELLQSIANQLRKLDMVGFFPMHPHTKQILKSIGVKGDDSLIFLEPVSYRESIQLIKNASLVITDSGGVQEESCILGIPSLIARETNERYETVGVGASVLMSPSVIVNDASIIKTVIENKKIWKHPYGEKVGEKIVKIIMEEFGDG